MPVGFGFEVFDISIYVSSSLAPMVVRCAHFVE